MDVWLSVGADGPSRGRIPSRIGASVLRCVLEFSRDLAPHNMLALESSDAVLVRFGSDRNGDAEVAAHSSTP